MTRFGHITPYYEVLFPARDPQVDRIVSLIGRAGSGGRLPRRWVDVGCGTGQQLEALADRGLEVWGLDLEAPMVERLQQRRPDLAERAAVGDMREADEVLAPLLPGPCGAVYCIGNTLVQLPRDGEIEEALNSIGRLLAPHGRLLIQIVNFDRVLAGELDLLPPLERSLPGGETVRLERRYAPSADPGRLRFLTRVEGPAGSREQAHDLRALRRPELDALLARTGFKTRSWEGDWTGQAWSRESPATIVEAEAAE